jgi:large subunit ribosomal protein L10
MNRDEKAAVIDRIAGKIEESDAVFAVDYRGISVPQVADLRTKLRDADASFQIVKNSLTERAADKAGAEGLKALLEGPTALAFVRGDAAAAAKALNDAARATQVLDFKGGVMGGNVLTAEDIRSIARLPSREVLYGQLVGTIASPLSGLVGALSALVGGLARQLGQIAEQGLVGGSEAPAAPEPEAAPDVQEAAEQPNDSTTAPPEAEAAVPADAEPHQAPEPQASQAEGEDTSSETPKED